jgi:hypothetical protein
VGLLGSRPCPEASSSRWTSLPSSARPTAPARILVRHDASCSWRVPSSGPVWGASARRGAWALGQSRSRRAAEVAGTSVVPCWYVAGRCWRRPREGTRWPPSCVCDLCAGAASGERRGWRRRAPGASRCRGGPSRTWAMRRQGFGSPEVARASGGLVRDLRVLGAGFPQMRGFPLWVVNSPLPPPRHCSHRSQTLGWAGGVHWGAEGPPSVSTGEWVLRAFSPP